jgi:hypothetical protein
MLPERPFTRQTGSVVECVAIRSMMIRSRYVVFWPSSSS